MQTDTAAPDIADPDLMPTNIAPKDIHVLLFDVGGVLVQLSGIEIMLQWLGNAMTVDEMWVKWLRSESVRQFETGKIDSTEFAHRVTREFGLSVEPHAFLESFAGWPTGLYPGTLEMLARIPRRYQRALLSNSNALHWPRVRNDMQLGAEFDSHFISHLTGRIKPDPEAFEHVVESLGCPPAQVLFLDDNLLNVQAARGIGMHAVHVRGPDEVERALAGLGLMEGSVTGHLADPLSAVPQVGPGLGAGLVHHARLTRREIEHSGQKQSLTAISRVGTVNELGVLIEDRGRLDRRKR